MNSETPTSTFGKLEIGARFRIPWTYSTMTVVPQGADEANAEDDAGVRYRFGAWVNVIQNVYTEMRQSQ